MQATLNNLKPAILAVAIAAGLSVHCDDAQAGQPETAVLAGGCFWCVESDFESVDGVIEVVSGFAGGKMPSPSYKQVVQGGTGHYEVVEITFDPDVVSYSQLIDLFFRSIDPTDANGQFCDRGDSYRSAIFATPDQTDDAKAGLKAAEMALGQKIVTPILGAATFYPAGEDHQDYYKKKDVILTRFGPRSKAKAYKLYRNACGRDQRVEEIWGPAAPFVGG